MTPVAASGPMSVSVIMYVMTSPTLGMGLLTVLVSCRSACCGVSVALVLLWAAVGSSWLAWVTVAVLVWATGMTTRACTCNVWGAPGAMVPTTQIPVVLV